MNIHENACVTPAGRAHRPDRDLASPAHDGRADRDPALQGALVALEPKPTRTQAHSNPSPLEPKPPVQRYENDKPGGMIHIDMKSTAASREAAIPSQATEQARERPAALAGGLPDEKKETACAFTSRACANGLTQRRIDHPPTGPRAIIFRTFRCQADALSRSASGSS
ncbi:MAG: hypothetical protein RJB09_2072 [Pseudomonadota bacterium]